MSSQANIPITIESYKETILCDIYPMDVRHILLGCPWKSYHEVIHEGQSNKIFFDIFRKKDHSLSLNTCTN